MGLKKVLSKTAMKFNPTRFLGADGIKKNAGFIRNLFYEVAKVKSGSRVSDRNKSFEELMQKAGMTEKDISKRLVSSKYFVLIGLILFFVLIVYSVFLFVTMKIFAGFITTMMSVLLLSYVWREHFLMIQLKHRKAFLTFKQWVNFTLKRK